MRTVKMLLSNVNVEERLITQYWDDYVDLRPHINFSLFETLHRQMLHVDWEEER